VSEKIIIKTYEVKKQGEKLNPGSLPDMGRIIFLGMVKRENLPSPAYFVPCVRVTETGFKFAAGNDVQKGPIVDFMEGDVWFPLMRNPKWVAPPGHEKEEIKRGIHRALDENHRELQRFTGQTTQRFTDRERQFVTKNDVGEMPDELARSFMAVDEKKGGVPND
jgi:hypothetical protein